MTTVKLQVLYPQPTDAARISTGGAPVMLVGAD